LSPHRTPEIRRTYEHDSNDVPACATSLSAASAAHAADQLLSGAIAARSGQKLEGVTVSAKLEAPPSPPASIRTPGNYFFPLLPSGKYRVWAQALGFETARAQSSCRRRGAGFHAAGDDRPRAALPPVARRDDGRSLAEASADDARAKKIFMNNCTGCHSTSYALQFRFDEAGWNKIIDLMKVVPVTGVYPGRMQRPTRSWNATRNRLPPTSRARAAGRIVD